MLQSLPLAGFRMRLITAVVAILALTLVSGRVAACPSDGEPAAHEEAACMFPVDIVGNDGLCDLVAYVKEGTSEQARGEENPHDTPTPHTLAGGTLVLARSVYDGDEIASTHPVDVIKLKSKVPPGHVVVFHCLRHDQPDSGLVAVAPLDHYQLVNAVAAWEVDFERQVFVETSPEGIVCEIGSGDGEVQEQAPDGTGQE